MTIKLKSTYAFGDKLLVRNYLGGYDYGYLYLSKEERWFEISPLNMKDLLHRMGSLQNLLKEDEELLLQLDKSPLGKELREYE